MRLNEHFPFGESTPLSGHSVRQFQYIVTFTLTKHVVRVHSNYSYTHHTVAVNQYQCAHMRMVTSNLKNMAGTRDGAAALPPPQPAAAAAKKREKKIEKRILCVRARNEIAIQF